MKSMEELLDELDYRALNMWGAIRQVKQHLGSELRILNEAEAFKYAAGLFLESVEELKKHAFKKPGEVIPEDVRLPFPS